MRLFICVRRRVTEYSTSSDDAAVARVCCPGLQAVIHAAQPVSDDSHHLQCEIGRLLHQELETLFVDLDELAGGFCDSAGATRHFVQQGHLAQNTAGAEAFNEPAFDQQINFAFNHDVNGNAAGITFAEYDLACRNGGVSAWLRNISIVPARIVWTRFCNSGRLSDGIRLTGFEG